MNRFITTLSLLAITISVSTAQKYFRENFYDTFTSREATKMILSSSSFSKNELGEGEMYLVSLKDKNLAAKFTSRINEVIEKGKMTKFIHVEDEGRTVRMFTKKSGDKIGELAMVISGRGEDVVIYLVGRDLDPQDVLLSTTGGRFSLE